MGPRATSGAGDEVLITEMEHHSNIVPWQIALRGDRRDAALPARSPTSHELSLDELDAVLAEGRVKLVAVAHVSGRKRGAHVSNVLGTINPVAEIAAPRPRGRRA